MKINRAFLTSKVAKRIFFLFLLCALLPLIVFAMITSNAVDSQLSEYVIKRLNQNCKVKGLEIYSNLKALEVELRILGPSLEEETRGKAGPGIYSSEQGMSGGFKKVTLVCGERKEGTFEQGIPEGFKLNPDELDHLSKGRALVSVQETAEAPPRILMVAFVKTDYSRESLVLGEIDPEKLWGMGSEEDSALESPMFILGPRDEILHFMPPGLQIREDILQAISRFPVAGTIEHDFKGDKYLTGYWRLFLKYHFFTPGWTIVMSQSQSTVLAPVDYFKKFFFLFALLTFLIVSLLSVVLIRKSLVPIEILRKGTEKISNGDFGIEVQIRSGDEFELLGRDFNEMSKKLKEGRAMLVQSAKMGAVGQMASGVVHEIGQPLTSISLLIDLLSVSNPTEAGKRRLDLMKEEVERLTSIISRFKNFARVSEQTMKPLSLNEVVEATYALLEHQITMKGIDCNPEKQGNLPLVTGDRNSLQQVLINLMINAMDALEGKKDEEPTIEVRTYSQDKDVCVEVKDNGCGIPKDIQEKIFDPFFTTKGPERGTGLGLAIIDSILHQHRGRVSLRSEVGKGTQFIVSFPVAS